VAIEGLLAGMDEAKAELGVTSKLIACFLRHLDEDAAFATLRAAEPWLDRIVGVGLDSSEVGHPPAKFARVFAAARERGLKLVAHAGEEGPPQYVWEALDVLKVDRIDHGNRALEDPALVRRLAGEGMTLTVCPLSNLKLCVVKEMTAHPLKRMLDLGLRATVNSDDPAYFGGYLGENWRAVAESLGLGRVDLAALARNSFTGSFLEPAEIAGHLAAIDAYAAATN
jgi:adenosine deaminase